jgi:threonine synthase
MDLKVKDWQGMRSGITVNTASSGALGAAIKAMKKQAKNPIPQY